MAEYKILDTNINSKLIGTTELHKTEGFSMTAIYKMCHMEGAPVVKFGNRFYFIRSKLNEFIESLAGQQL
ncbi:hypothetical protein [Clostridium pasteurianum]|uniref:Helix-turn-helix domain-containing protein n=1 Tax=Clostridium pasteurianum BC1 TaxID=86416 RepID=R4JY19_CLOPA|nr:hypothetical protein [Clostridium pasteurianum]AGK95178.1 hypothetical protein Clopa_0078 [Clostridium pasteurianum BC1]